MCCQERIMFFIPVRIGSLALGFIQALSSLLVFLLVTAASITWIVDKNLIVNIIFNVEIVQSIVNVSEICLHVGDVKHSVLIDASWWSFIAMGWILLTVHGLYAVVLIKGVKNKKDAFILSYFNYSAIVNVILTVVTTVLLIFGFLASIQMLIFISIAPFVIVIFNSLLLIMVWQTYRQIKLEHALDIVEKRLYKDYMTDIDRAPPPRVSFGSRIYDDPGNFDINNGRSIGVRTEKQLKPFYERLQLRGD